MAHALRLIMVFLLIMPAAGACVAPQEKKQYPHSHKAYDVTISWATQQRNSQLTLDGSIKNTRFATMDDIEIIVRLLDRQGRELAEKAQFIPGQLRIDEDREFTVTLPHSGAADRISFFYRYSYREGQDSGGKDFHTFETDLP